jgi:hypothetical protein
MSPINERTLSARAGIVAISSGRFNPTEHFAAGAQFRLLQDGRDLLDREPLPLQDAQAKRA